MTALVQRMPNDILRNLRRATNLDARDSCGLHGPAVTDIGAPETQSAERRIEGWVNRLNRPLTPFACVMGWIGSSAVFLGVVKALGGPTEGDAAESVYSTWAISHANFACAYPPPTAYHFPSVASPFAFSAPLYPFFTGLVAAILRIGHRFSFPNARELGPNCSHAFVDIFHWSAQSSSIGPTINLAYLVWPVLMFATVAFLRASGRGRRGWEPLTLLILALSPPVVMCIVDFFHPQDVLAVALILAGLACAKRDRWGWAGVLIAFAFLAQQFGVLVAAPLLVVAPKGQRVRYAVASAGTVAISSLALFIGGSSRALKAALLGSNRIGLVNVLGWRSRGGTILWETNLRGLPLLFVSRILPILFAVAIAWWLARQLGDAIREPIPLMSLVATSLALRLVFEENLFGYYFMAVTVSLLLLDVLSGRIRGPLIAWISLVTLAFNPVHWGLYTNWTPWGRQLFEGLPIAAMAVGATAIAIDAVHKRVRVYKVIWLLAVALACEPQFWGPSVGQQVLPTWCWQVTLVPIALWLCVGPLVTKIKQPSLQKAISSVSG